MRFLRHRKAMDVCFRVYNLKEYKPGVLTIKGEWWNMGYVNSYNIGIKQTIKINKTDLRDWYHLSINDADVVCLRNVSGWV